MTAISASSRQRVLIFGLLLGAFSTLIAQDAQAVLLSYRFEGTVNSGTLDLGSGATDISGAAYVITGQTVSDVDLSTSASIGQFAATSTFSFAGIGSFTTDAGDDDFSQNGPSGSIDRIGLYDAAGGDGGFLGLFSPSVAADPNVAVGLGAKSPFYTNSSGLRSYVNASGQSLSLMLNGVDDVTYMRSDELTTVPEPSSAALLALVVGGLGLARSRWRRRS